MPAVWCGAAGHKLAEWRFDSPFSRARANYFSAMRLFVAVDPSPSIRDEVLVVRDALKPMAPKAKWSSASSWHVTLAFIGERTSKECPAIAEALEAALSSHRRFTLRLRGIGTFGSAASPSVLWVGVERSEALIALAEATFGALAPFGYVVESRGYNPHLTLARSRFASGNPDLSRCRDDFVVRDIGACEVDRVRLYQSHADASGASNGVVAETALHSES